MDQRLLMNYLTQLFQGTVCPPPRYAHSATIVGRQLLIFGGQGEDGPLNVSLWLSCRLRVILHLLSKFFSGRVDF